MVGYSIIPQLLNTNAGLKEQIAAATDPVVIKTLEEKLHYSLIARFMLLALFAGISWLVYVAYQKRIKEGRIKL